MRRYLFLLLMFVWGALCGAGLMALVCAYG
jgi:hypothetical protein